MRKALNIAKELWKKLRACMGMLGHKLASLLHAHGGKIAYYACVALVLSAIAYAAEQYRGERSSEADPLMLPATELEAAAPVESEPALVLAEGMERLRGFANIPEWNASLGLWETHAAVDYACSEDAVFSLSAGTVRTVGRSGVYGGFVEVETEEYLLRYASVSADEAIAPGMEIAVGERIGTADVSMPAEAQMGAHLHLELFLTGEAVNFETHAEKNRAAAD